MKRQSSFSSVCSCLSIVASSVVVLGLGCLVGCSQDSTGEQQGTGGTGSGGQTATGGTSGTGGSAASGGNVGTGGASKGTGGATTGTGGSTTGSGGRTTGTGGRTTGTGGGSAGAGGATTGTGGSNVGTGGSTTGTGGSRQDGGPGGSDGAASDARAGTGGTAGATGGSPGTGGSTSSGGSTGTKSAGCGKTITRQDAKTQKTMSVGGTSRYYLLYTPTTYDPETPLPMVFVLHGMDMNNWWAANDASGFKMIEASANKAILVYPQGSGDAPGTTSKWGGISSNWTDSGNDLQFIDDLVTSMKDSYCVDTKRVFVTGFSMGGMMTESLACTRSKVFRAAAPVAGWGPGGFGGMNNPTCSDASVTVPVVITQGTADRTVTEAMGKASRDFWIKRNTCSNTTSNVTVPSGGATCVAYQGCKEGTAVNYCSHGGEHNVPGNAGAYIWSFFSAYN